VRRDINLFGDRFDTYFDGLEKDPRRGRRFAGCMAFFHAGAEWEVDGLIGFFEWESLGDGLGGWWLSLVGRRGVCALI
jgi:hypothetical protein